MITKPFFGHASHIIIFWWILVENAPQSEFIFVCSVLVFGQAAAKTTKQKIQTRYKSVQEYWSAWASRPKQQTNHKNRYRSHQTIQISKIYAVGCTVKWADDGNRLREWIYFFHLFFLASFETAMIYIPTICKLKAIRTPNANIIISNCRKSNRLMKETEKTLWALAHALTPACTGILCGNTSYIHSNTRTGHDCWFFFLFLLSKLYIIEAPSCVRRASVLVSLRNENIIVLSFLLLFYLLPLGVSVVFWTTITLLALVALQ